MIGRRRSEFNEVVIAGLSLMKSDLRRFPLISGRVRADWKNKGKEKKTRTRPWPKVVEGKHMTNRDGERKRERRRRRREKDPWVDGERERETTWLVFFIYRNLEDWMNRSLEERRKAKSGAVKL